MQCGCDGLCHHVSSSRNSSEAEEEKGNIRISFRFPCGDTDRPVTHGLGDLGDDYVVVMTLFVT